MRFPFSRHPNLRSALVLTLAAGAFEACGAGDGPLDPSGAGPAEPVADVVAPAGMPTGNAVILTPERIAFNSSGPLHSVWMSDPTGGQRQALFTQSSGAWSPAWSWDNKQVAMVRPRVTNGVTRNDILLMNSDGTNQHWARSQGAVWDFADPNWAPNGVRIAMTIVAGGVPYLGWMEPSTGKAGYFYFPLGGAVPGTRPSFNKAGTKILYVGAKGKTIEEIKPDGSGHVVRISSDARLDWPSYSPDGTRIAYEKGPLAGNTDIFIKTVGTGVTVKRTWSTAADRKPSWSPDGTRIAFMSARNGQLQIYTMKAATGGDVLRISKDSYYAEDEPAWMH